MISCQAFRSTVRPGSDDANVLQHLRSCDSCLEYAVQVDPDYFFRSLSDELLPLARVTVEFLAEAGKSERIQQRQQRRCESIRQFLHWLLSDAQARGEVRSDVDIDASVELMIALNEGILLLSVAGLRNVDLETLKPAYVSLLDHGLADPTRPVFAPAQAPASASVNGAQHTGGI